MKALVSASKDTPQVRLADLDDPQPNTDQAVIEVKAISINRGEVNHLPARDPSKPNGWDLAGVVREAAADGTGPQKDARVVGLVHPQGAWAELVAVPTFTLAELPASVSFEDASTLPVAGLTALRALENAGFVLEDRVAITGASGGVGRFAIQLAKLGGAHVTAFARRQDGLAELGADSVEERIEPEGEQFRAILDAVGGEILGNCIQRVAPGGTVISFASTVQEPVTYPTRALFGESPGAKIYGSMLFNELRRNDNSGPHDLTRLANLVAAGKLKTSIDLTLPFDQAQEAIDALLSGGVKGKAVLTL
jgi:NADPH:quinone reductase-like Zn-dependent oxidoreductase